RLVELDRRARRAAAQENCAELAGANCWNNFARWIQRFTSVPDRLVVSKDGITKFRRRICFARFCAARRSCAISLALGRAVAGRGGAQRSDTGTIHVVHYFCGLCRRRNSGRGARYAVRVPAVVRLRSRRRSLRGKTPGESNDSFIPRGRERR